MFIDHNCSVSLERFDYVLAYELERPELAATMKYIEKIEQVLHSVQNGIECVGAKIRNSWGLAFRP
jgi:hypothetical protein